MKLITHGNLHIIEHEGKRFTLTDRGACIRRKSNLEEERWEVVPGRIEVSDGKEMRAAVDYSHIYDDKRRVLGSVIIKTEIKDRNLWDAGLKEGVREHLAKRGHVTGL
jgi:hypothetical protein